MKRILTAAILLGMLSAPVLARKAAVATPADLIARTEARVEQGDVDPSRDLAPLIDGLRAARNDDDKGRFVDAIEEIGAADGASPAAVKAWMVAHAPPALLDIARSDAGWSLRGDALMALRSLDAPDAVLDEAIAIARADRSDSRGFIHSRGALLEDWKESRSRHGGAPAAAQPQDAATEQRALELLRTRSVGVSVDSLSNAIGQSRSDVVEALLDAGVDVNAPGPAGMSLLVTGVMVACSNKNPLDAQLATLDLLVRRGVEVDRKDERGNTVLISAVQSCPLPIVEKLVASGAAPNPVNAQQFTPLKMAFVGGHWDIADFLVGKGARLTAKEADQLFFEKPTDPAQLAILRRATGPAK